MADANAALAQFIAAGNTQPGGFAQFVEPETLEPEYDALPEPESEQPEENALNNYCERRQLRPLLGENTLKMFSEFVENSVQQQPEPEQQPNEPLKAPRGHWEISSEMMNQNWGSVLRQLQPSSGNRALVRQAPAFLTGKTYDAGGVTPRVGSSMPGVTPRVGGGCSIPTPRAPQPINRQRQFANPAFTPRAGVGMLSARPYMQ